MATPDISELLEKLLDTSVETASEEFRALDITGTWGLLLRLTIAIKAAQTTADIPETAAVTGMYLLRLSAALTDLIEPYRCSGLNRVHFSITNLYGDLA